MTTPSYLDSFVFCVCKPHEKFLPRTSAMPSHSFSHVILLSNGILDLLQAKFFNLPFKFFFKVIVQDVFWLQFLS